MTVCDEREGCTVAIERAVLAYTLVPATIHTMDVIPFGGITADSVIDLGGSERILSWRRRGM